MLRTGQLAIAGSFFLAQAITERIREKSGLEEASRFVVELLCLMLRARGACLELASELLPAPVCFPEGLAFDRAGQAVSYPLMADLTPIGTLRLFFAPGEMPAGLSDAATVQFTLASLAAIAASALDVAHKLAKLTPAEERVLGLLHLRTPEILARLCISHETLRTHTKAIFRKLEVKTRKEALRLLTLKGSGGEALPGEVGLRSGV